jgi:pilus assembly protein CpaF
MQLEVLIASSGKQECRLLPADQPVTIGRGTDCTIALESALVSRRHVTVEVSRTTMRVWDSSRNGTLAGALFVNNSMAEVPLGTPLTIGEFTISLRPANGGGAWGAPAGPSPLPNRMGVSPMAAPRLEAIGSSAPPAARPELFGAPAVPAPRPGLVDTPTSPPSMDLRSREREVEEATKRREGVELRREIHRLLLEHLDLATIEPAKLDDPSLRPKVLTALRRIVRSLEEQIPPDVNRDSLVGEMVDEALGLGPLENLLSDPSVTEIMVVDPDTIYIEQGGKLTQAPARFTDDDRVRAIIERIVTPLGRRIDESSPLVDARLRDGSRVNAIIRPLALRGSAITIRKFSKSPLTLENLMQFGALTEAMGRFLSRSVIARKNIVISGGTGSGKTTLLNVLSGAIPHDERIVTIEDAAELQLRQPHVVSLETRPPNMEGKGEYTIRDLVKNALRMRPDRIVVGECRGGEALDMLQAMNTGHDGSLTTTHANSPREAIARLETLVLMSGLELPVRAIREQIAGAVNLLVQQSRLSDGSRKVTAISEVTGVSDEGEIELVPIFQFIRTGTSETGKVLGEFQATGFLPTFLNEFLLMGLVKPKEPYL